MVSGGCLVLGGWEYWGKGSETKHGEQTVRSCFFFKGELNCVFHVFLDWLMADNIVPIILLKTFGEEWDETTFTKSIVANKLNPIVVSIPNWG